ncbi:MAG: phosphoribosylanthranilate isomerase, partial [Pseudomonadota bacterium]|nr:phosphoribosylanthranilate isomerase [Pseudomonadota bacterium]
ADAADADTQLAVPPRRVALCVNASDDELAAIIDAARPDMLQLHGNENVERVRAIKSKFSLPVMPVIKVADKADIEKAELFSDCADWLLFDAAPNTAMITNQPNLPGGTGMSFDWQYLAEVELPLPFMLAGGLTIANVAQAVTLTNAPCVDVSSGVEKNRGEKSKTAISAFVKAAKFG